MPTANASTTDACTADACTANASAADACTADACIQTMTNLWGDNEVAQVKATMLLIPKTYFNNVITLEKVITFLRRRGYLGIELDTERDIVLSDDKFAILDYYNNGFSGYKNSYKSAMVNSHITRGGVFPILIVERLYINVIPRNSGEEDYVEEATREIVRGIH